jgi:CheY-like chemotaxis protein
VESDLTTNSIAGPFDARVIAVVINGPDARAEAPNHVALVLGHYALALAAADDFHLIVSDIARPFTDGFELLRRVRQGAGISFRA